MYDLTIFLIIAIIFLIIGTYFGVKLGIAKTNRMWEKEVPSIRKDATTRSRAVLEGQFTEQLAPYLPDFPYAPTEVRFIGKPIDFIVFKGMEHKNINEVVFVEVKTGNSKLSTTERNLRETILKGNVSWKEYRISKQKN